MADKITARNLVSARTQDAVSGLSCRINARWNHKAWVARIDMFQLFVNVGVKKSFNFTLIDRLIGSFRHLERLLDAEFEKHGLDLAYCHYQGISLTPDLSHQVSHQMVAQSLHNGVCLCSDL